MQPVGAVQLGMVGDMTMRRRMIAASLCVAVTVLALTTLTGCAGSAGPAGATPEGAGGGGGAPGGPRRGR